MSGGTEVRTMNVVVDADDDDDRSDVGNGFDAIVVVVPVSATRSTSVALAVSRCRWQSSGASSGRSRIVFDVGIELRPVPGDSPPVRIAVFIPFRS